MINTGITRPVDSQGRVVLPIELLKTLDISKKDCLDVFVDGNELVLRKTQSGCVFCGEMERLILFHENQICEECVKGMAVL